MKKLFIFCLLLSLVNIISAKQYFFKKYQVEAGLSHNTVWCIFQDSYGFVWFGTNDGLNCFDGRKFSIYRNDIQNTFSLGNNSVQTLFEDGNRNLWVGTSSGIYIYEREKGHFVHFSKKTQYDVSISGEVKKIVKTKNGKMWIATLGQGFFLYDPITDDLKQYSQHTAFVWDIDIDSNDRVYLSSLQEGLICYNQDGKYIESYSSFLNNKSLANPKINCIHVIEDSIWFSIGTNNLSCLDSKTKQISHYNNKDQNIGTIRAISRFSNLELLVGSDNGLYTFNILSHEFIRMDNPMDSRSLSDQSIYDILKDEEGGFWISTYLGGVNYLAPQTKVFEYYSPTSAPLLSTGKVISQFCEDKDRNIWIGSQDGLKVLNNKTQKLEVYKLPLKNQKLDIRSLLIDEDNLWIGTYSEGLKVINLKTNHLKEYYHIRESTNTICSNDILSLYKDTDGNIYVGTSWGLCRYNRTDDNFETLNFVGTMTSVFDIMQDRSGFLWVATHNSGVFRYEFKGGQWKHYIHEDENLNSINSNSVITLFEESNGRIWFGTNGGGLCYFNEGDESFTDFDPSNEILPNKVIYSIEEDRLGNFWISSNAGLLRINPTDKASRKLFTQEDGLQSNQFNFKASLKSDIGKLYFGGINGFNAFFPVDFKENSYIPPVYIVNIRLYNTDDEEGRKLLNLTGAVYLAKEIELPYANNSLVLEFSALSYEEPIRNKYKYKLEGFDKDWVNSENSNLASYTNLPPGEYVFRVKGANNDSKWNEDGASVHIVILPPWWRSTLAYMIYILCFVIAFYFIWKYINRRSKNKFQRQLEEFQVEKEKEVYQSKISFFINLVHEIRTPLSLISLPLEKLSEHHKEDIKEWKYLKIINKNVNYLLDIVNQLLDFQKIENRNTQLNLKEESLDRLLYDVHEQFLQSAESEHIHLLLSLPQHEIRGYIDREKITKIIVNLLGNALKFAKTRIELRLQCFDDHFEIAVIDDGPGISDSEKNKVFEAFYQIGEKNNTNTGTGIGLAFSKLLAENHKGNLSLTDNEWGGSSFILSIPTMYDETIAINEPATDIFDSMELLESDRKETVSAFSNYKVLLVEDNIELLNMIDDSLNPYFSILKVENGKKALDILSTETVDIIVSDVMMPEMDGFELCRYVKSDVNYSHIPVVLLTAKATLEAKLEGLEYGADVYLEKPFSIRHLRKQIENLIKLRLSLQKMITAYPVPVTVDLSISKKDKEFLDRLHSEIENHIAELDFSIDNIAETMFMSRSSFYRKIKGITGMSPNDYLKVLRLNKAAEMILHGDLPMSEICERVAFSSSSYFAKCFKTQFGVLPKDYVAEKQKGI
ncbi:response regulator [Dysgonomonas sp. Marseille-P4677]|uniref:hybrid sensor histidine kinase/response regulator transcription factor n=1 Tax=Dysgonomonas sp. Marseille-P4677 TaxID=2364790 RepID=UPI0019124D0E|nr:two-component regulator propeller domain-containing protein [Dysgonomonas sp. Marseille-P4677]MBK5721332.1 response regulator [Dysgonomonas sp. Marseille-P4677]